LPASLALHIPDLASNPSSISPPDLHAALVKAEREIAVVDIREGGRYADGHISVAVELPLSEIELLAPALLPRSSVSIVITDEDGGDIAQRAAARLTKLGYTDVGILQGGVAAWRGAGFELITGLNSLSKALGEFVERHYHTPRITAEELRRRIDEDPDFVILDTRPLEEFHHISIPGGVAAPGAELLYRVFDKVPSPDTPIVINCAGRTRAILGAQILLNAGLPNPVVSLENGTAAWLLAGYTPGRGATETAGDPSAAGIAQASAAAVRIETRFGVTRITAETLAKFRAEADRHSLYLLDVRTDGEFAESHLPGSRSAPGGQIVQATDKFIGSRGGRVVLIDEDNAVRAIGTASWLIQLGLDHVFVYAATPAELTERGVASNDPGNLQADTVSPAEAKHLVDGEGAVVLDLEPAPPYYRERRYIPGSFVARRSTLPDTISQATGSGPIVLTSANGDIARYAAVEIGGRTARRVVALAGGTGAWIAADNGYETGLDQPALVPAEKLPPLPTLDERRVSLDAYVKWGDVIVDQLERDGIVRFRAFA
jgi:rhodanese-related sulfurtransferase